MVGMFIGLAIEAIWPMVSLGNPLFDLFDLEFREGGSFRRHSVIPVGSDALDEWTVGGVFGFDCDSLIPAFEGPLFDIQAESGFDLVAAVAWITVLFK